MIFIPLISSQIYPYTVPNQIYDLIFINKIYLCLYVLFMSCILITFIPHSFTCDLCPCPPPQIKQNSGEKKNEENKMRKKIKTKKERN